MNKIHLNPSNSFIKKAAIFFILFFPFFAHSQTQMDIDTLTFNFSEVVNSDTLDAKTLYSNAKLFVAQAFVSAKNVTQLEDENTHTIVAKGLLVLPLKDLPFSFSYMKELVTSFTLQIQTKDGKYKYALTDFVVKDNEVYDGYNLSLPYTKQKGEMGEKAHKKLWDDLKTTAFDYVSKFIPLMKSKIVTVDNF